MAFLIDTISCDTAGTQKQLLETIRRLNRHVFDPYLICLFESEWMRKNEVPCPCFVLGYHGFLKLDFGAVIQRLIKFISEQRIEIINTFFEDSIFVAFVGAHLCRTKPVLISSRRDMGLGNENRPWYHSLYTLALPFVNRGFDGIIANSEQVRHYVAEREKTPIEKIEVIRNGVEVPGSAASIPSVFLENDADCWLGIVASLTPVKRHDILLYALEKIKAQLSHEKIRVIILGEGRNYDTLVALAEELQVDTIVHFIGAVNDVYPYLYNLDIGVLCSAREGLSNAILEYMACGLPVVATAVGGNIELVDETNGVCVPPDDPDNLANALMSLICSKQLRERLGAASLDKIKENYSWDKTMDAFESYCNTFPPIDFLTP